MKRIIAATLASVMTISNVFAKDITVTLNGKDVEFANQSPVIVDGRTLIPLRGVFEKLGYTVEWNGDTKTASLSGNNKNIDVTAGSSIMTVDKSNNVPLDVPAQIINGSMMLPLRAIGEASGLVVEWNSDSKTVAIGTGANDTESPKEDKTVSKISEDTAEYAEVCEFLFTTSSALSGITDAITFNIITAAIQGSITNEMFENIHKDMELYISILNMLSPKNENEKKIKELALNTADIFSEELKIMELVNSGSVTDESAEKMIDENSEKMTKTAHQLDSAINQYSHIAEGFYLENFDTGILNDEDTERLGELIDKLVEADNANLSEVASTELSLEAIFKSPLHYAKDMRENAKARDKAFSNIEVDSDFKNRVEVLLCANGMLEKAADVLEKYNNKQLSEDKAEFLLDLYLILYDNFNMDGADGMLKPMVALTPLEYDISDFGFDKTLDKA